MGGCPGHGRTFCCIPGFCPLCASRTSISPMANPSHDNQKCFQTFSNAPGGWGWGNYTWWKTTALYVTVRLLWRTRNRNKYIKEGPKNHEFKDLKKSSYEIRISWVWNNVLHFWEGEKSVSHSMPSLIYSSVGTLTCKLWHCAPKEYMLFGKKIFFFFSALEAWTANIIVNEMKTLRNLQASSV